jgi:RNA polymerase sigma factor (sigma-70 family)
MSGKRRPYRDPVRAIRNVASDPRSLPEFEEHVIVDAFRWSPARLTATWQPQNWRSVDDSSTISGRYECLDCGGRHQLPGPGYPLICESLPQTEATRRAVGRIERFIAKARGQHAKIAAEILADASRDVVHFAQYYPAWGRGILDEYRRHPMLEHHIAALENPPRRDRENAPPPNAGKMISDHLPLVRKLAGQRALQDDSLFSDLENVGMRALEEAADRFDPTFGVTFGAFVQKRLAGAMDAWLTRERVVYVNNAYDMALERERVADERRSLGAPRRHRTSTGGYRETPYISTSVRPVRRPDGASTGRLISKSIRQDLEAALEKLNPRQREVYRGRVLSDPPVPRSLLATRLGIKDERQIPRIEKQARQKMARLLKVSPPERCPDLLL